jgi:hypothetical protein
MLSAYTIGWYGYPSAPVNSVSVRRLPDCAIQAGVSGGCGNTKFAFLPQSACGGTETLF